MSYPHYSGRSFAGTLPTGQFLAPAGSSLAPSYSFSSDTDTGIYNSAANIVSFAVGGSQRARVTLSGFDVFGALSVWNTGGSTFATLANDATNILAQRNGTNAQTLRVYGTFTDTNNYERATLSTQQGASITLAAETAGTGGDNLDVILTPAGTGNVRFGTHTAIGTETVTGFITIKDAAGNSRKLAVVS